jgi:4-hydroxybenzoate polyprenyltransferase
MVEGSENRDKQVPAPGEGRLERPRAIRLLITLLALACGVVLVLDFVVHRHVEFDFEAWYGFYAIFGFIAYCGIVLSAKQLRKILRRDEDYYGE